MSTGALPVTIPVFTSPEGEAAVMGAYEGVMDAWPIERDELKVATSFGDTHVIAGGPSDGHPVVLLHALFATAASWYRVIEPLSQDHRTYAVDVVGEGNKSRPIRPIASLDDFLQWFTELLDGLGVTTLDLVGNSYGGFTAAYYAMKLPERVRKLALIGPAATIHSMWPFMIHMFIPKGIYLMAPRLPGQARVMRSSVDWMHAGLPADPKWEPLFQQTMRHGSLINRVFPRVYRSEELSEIKAPVLFIFGEREVVYGNLRSATEAARRLIPSAEIALIPDAHHITAIAQPRRFNEALLGFLQA
jgi:pimeloyl-ACP methyl ester carboxylesterase